MFKDMKLGATYKGDRVVSDDQSVNAERWKALCRLQYGMHEAEYITDNETYIMDTIVAEAIDLAKPE